MTTRTRLQRIERERRRRAAEVGRRVCRQLSDSDLDALAGNLFDGMSDEQLARIAQGLERPQVEEPPIDPAVLKRLCDLTTPDEQRLLGLSESRFKHPTRGW